MIGARIYPDAEGRLRLAEGDYGKGADGIWYARPPGVPMRSSENHEVTEHEDGTISVSPSILVQEEFGVHTVSWHGFLEHGVWRSC